MTDGRKTLFLRIFGCGVEIDCRDAGSFDLLTANYGYMQSSNPRLPQLKYIAFRRANKSGFGIADSRGKPLIAHDDSEFLFLFEKDLTIRLQQLRRDLYFLHAAALGFYGRAFLLVGASGNGKSTTTWALLHHGFEYLSDELAAVDLDALGVEPYPHAICLKQNPPAPYFLPYEALRTSSTTHIPVCLLPTGTITGPMPAAAIFFLDYSAGNHAPGIRTLSSGETAARLFTHALNPLAHPEDGLPAAARIAQNVPSFYLTSGELTPTCELIINTLKVITSSNRSPAGSKLALF